jgi:hypothetical protein
VASVDGGGSPTRVTNGALVHGFCWGSRQNEEWAMAKLTSLISWAGGGNMAQSSLDGGGVTPAVHLPQNSISLGCLGHTRGERGAAGWAGFENKREMAQGRIGNRKSFLIFKYFTILQNNLNSNQV